MGIIGDIIKIHNLSFLENNKIKYKKKEDIKTRD